jgi:hypothetical protein
VDQLCLTQEEESTLMVVERREFHFESTPHEGGYITNLTASSTSFDPWMAAGGLGLSTVTSSLMHLVEEKISVHFSNEVKKESKRLVLELDSNIHNIIKFEDGFVVEIEGVDTMLFVCKNGELISLTSVYLIPKRTTNIVSMSQLDKIRYEIVINGGVLGV